MELAGTTLGIKVTGTGSRPMASKRDISYSASCRKTGR
tara:strand:- start:1674 stop:1787 length:114 start_codon:yes stop_codon:yes gene_type:complete